MTYFPAKEPKCRLENCPRQIDAEIIPRSVDLGGFQVSRVLPSKIKRTVGPFVFWDQAGPGEFLIGKGLDVRPHPHICLSTLTYLFQGNLIHRDTLGSHQLITPGDVNLMTAGHGIAHSERSPQEDRLHSQDFFGIQCWLALPLNKEEMDPTFKHHDKSQLPFFDDKDVHLRLVAGEWMGIKSPVNTYNDALFVECKLKVNANYSIPSIVEERAIHILSGEIKVDKVSYGNTRMLILKPSQEINVTATIDAHFIILGGTPLEQPRHLWWNFVASSQERIEQAKQDWKEGKFGKIPGDDKEFIPLPE